MEWQTLFPKSETIDADSLGKKIVDVFYDGFGLPYNPDRSWSAPEAAAMVRRCDMVGVLVDKRWQEAIICGCACYVMPEEPVVNALHLIWEDGICIRKPQQGGRWSKPIFELALSTAKQMGRHVGYIGGRTQNPVVMHRYSKFGKLFPFDSRYTTSQGRRVVEFLVGNIWEAQAGEFNPESGIFRGAYKEGRLGDYPIPETDEVRRWEMLLMKDGFDRNNGDAVAVVARVNAEN